MKRIFLLLLVILISSNVQSTDRCANSQTDLEGCYPNSADKDVLEANFEYLRQGYETLLDYYKRNDEYFKTQHKEGDRRFLKFCLMCIDHAIRQGIIGKRVFSVYDNLDDRFDKLKLFLTKQRDSPASDVEMHFFAEDYRRMMARFIYLATGLADFTDIARQADRATSGLKNEDWKTFCSPPIRHPRQHSNEF